MPLRRTILKLLLISLALAAVAGVLAVLLPTRDVMVKVMLTGLTTALAALLMIGLSYLLARPTTRPAGLYGMCAVVADFALWLALIWLEWWLTRPNIEEQIAVTAVFLLLVSVPMLLYLMLFGRPVSVVAGAVGAVSAAGALILFNMATWLPGNPFWGNNEWWGTAWTVLGYGAIVAAPLIGVTLAPRHWWRWGGAFVGIVATAVLIYIVWLDPFEPDASARWLCVLTSLATVAGFINLALLPNLKGGQRWVRIATIAAAVLTALFVNAIVLGEHILSDDLFERFFAASAIVTGCGSLALVVLMALNRRGAIEPSTAALLEVALACPVCGAKQSVPVGSSACRKCGLKMTIRLEEPRCPECDYLLLRLASDHCPECGALVRKPDEEVEA